MTRKLVWVMAVAVVGMVWYDWTRSLRVRRHRAETRQELGRWEDEGGNVAGTQDLANR
jgi:hypothetical protein